MSNDTPHAESEFEQLEKGLNRTRVQKDAWWIYFTIFYVPIGLLLLVVRLCISMQALLLLLVLPDSFPLKRAMLRVVFAVLGLVVMVDENYDSSVKVLVVNKVSSLDHLLFHLIVDCISIYPKVDHPLTPHLLPHHILVAKDDETYQREASKIVVTSVAVTQPEGVATNRLHILLKYRVWPFVLDDKVQPVALEAFRPLNVAGLNITAVDALPILDLLLCFYTPVTIFRIRYLPVLSRAEEESVERFANRTQQVAGRALKLTCTQLDCKDVQKWMRSHEQAPPRADNSAAPFIPISQFNKMVPQDPQLEVMVGQVSDVLPQIPDHVIRDDLMHTRDIDKTITNILEGRVQYEHTPSDVTAQQFNDDPVEPDLKSLSFTDRKAAFMKEARRRFISKHGH